MILAGLSVDTNGQEYERGEGGLHAPKARRASPPCRGECAPCSLNPCPTSRQAQADSGQRSARKVACKRSARKVACKRTAVSGQRWARRVLRGSTGEQPQTSTRHNKLVAPPEKKSACSGQAQAQPQTSTGTKQKQKSIPAKLKKSAQKQSADAAARAQGSSRATARHGTAGIGHSRAGQGRCAPCGRASVR